MPPPPPPQQQQGTQNVLEQLRRLQAARENVASVQRQPNNPFAPSDNSLEALKSAYSGLDDSGIKSSTTLPIVRIDDPTRVPVPPPATRPARARQAGESDDLHAARVSLDNFLSTERLQFLVRDVQDLKQYLTGKSVYVVAGQRRSGKTVLTLYLTGRKITYAQLIVGHAQYNRDSRTIVCKLTDTDQEASAARQGFEVQHNVNVPY